MLRIKKIINFILNCTAVLAIFVVAIKFTEIVLIVSEVPEWLSYIIYFGVGVSLYYPTMYIFKH